MTDPTTLRAADADRETVVRALSDQLSAGRLSVQEFDERCRGVYAAKTYADLAPITADLPLPAPLVRPPGAPAPARKATTGRVTGYPHPVDPAQIVRQQAPSDPQDREVVGRRPPHEHPLAGLAGYLVVSTILVGIWLVSGAGYFWPVWWLGFGLFTVFGRHGRRGRCG